MVGPMTKTAPAIAVRGLVKRYGAIRAADGVDLTIEAGQIYALLGPNGAGKTTTVEILEGFRHRDEGDVRVLGTDPGERQPRLPHADRDRVPEVGHAGVALTA